MVRREFRLFFRLRCPGTDPGSQSFMDGSPTESWSPWRPSISVAGKNAQFPTVGAASAVTIRRRCNQFHVERVQDLLLTHVRARKPDDVVFANGVMLQTESGKGSYCAVGIFRLRRITTRSPKELGEAGGGNSTAPCANQVVPTLSSLFPALRRGFFSRATIDLTCAIGIIDTDQVERLKNPLLYTGNVGERLGDEEGDLFPPALLGLFGVRGRVAQFDETLDR